MSAVLDVADRPAGLPQPGSRLRADAGVAFASLLAIVLWEASGGDLVLSHLYGSAAGFAWRDAWFTRTLLHDGGRWLAGAALALFAWDTFRPLAPGPTRRRRAYWLAVVVASLVLVPMLKRASATSCPWDLAEFGGHAAYVPHWLLGVVDGGAGHCFPSGHAVSAFAFLGLYFLWRPHQPRRAAALLWATLLFGAIFGWAQLARGAHFASHTLWSAWLCWALAVVADRWVNRAGAPVAAFAATETLGA